MGNLMSSGSSHHCCCKCFCCLNESDKVELVMRKFYGIPVSQAMDNTLQKLVGRVVLAGQPFYAPANGMPCVYYHLTVEEERIEHYTERDQNGQEHRRRRYHWHTILNEEKMTDFYLQDGMHKVFIAGHTAKVQGVQDVGGDTEFSIPPPGIAMIIGRSIASFDWVFHGEHRTGRFRYRQCSYNCNELVAALGYVQPGVDATNQPIKKLIPIRGDYLTPQFMEANKWEEWDKESWVDLVSRTPAVMLSDKGEFTNGVMVAPIPQLPSYMIYNPNANPWGASPSIASVPVVGAAMGMAMGVGMGMGLVASPMSVQPAVMTAPMAQGYPPQGYPQQQGYVPPQQQPYQPQYAPQQQQYIPQQQQQQQYNPQQQQPQQNMQYQQQGFMQQPGSGPNGYAPVPGY